MSLPSRDKLLLSLTCKRVVDSAAQHGGRGRTVAAAGLIALAVLLGGCERREIVRPTPQMDVETRFWVRVLLLADATECTVAASSGLRVSRFELSSVARTGSPMAASAATPVRVTLADGQLLLGGTAQPGRNVMVSTEPPHVFTLNRRSYRGRLKLTVNPSGRTFSAINLVPLEPYLAGVVGAEMPSYWEPEALKAQAITARTYCLYTKDRFGVNRGWDVSSTQASQVYRGVEAESAQTWQAVTGTYGKVLVSSDEGAPGTGLFPAYYSSTCGGHTEDCRRVFGEAFRPLQGVAPPLAA